MEIFGKRVKKELKEQGRTQTELADFLNVRKSTVSEWVNDNNEPPMEAIVEITRLRPPPLSIPYCSGCRFCRFCMRFQLIKPYKSLIKNIIKQMTTER